MPSPHSVVRIIPRREHHREIELRLENPCGACWGCFEGARHDITPIDERQSDVNTLADGKIRTRRHGDYRTRRNDRVSAQLVSSLPCGSATNARASRRAHIR